MTPNEAHLALSDNLTEYCIDCGRLTTRGHSAYTNRFDFRWRCAGCQVAYIVDKRGTWSDVVTADTPPGFELRTRKTQGEIMRASGYRSPEVQDWAKLERALDAAPRRYPDIKGSPQDPPDQFRPKDPPGWLSKCLPGALLIVAILIVTALCIWLSLPVAK
jgi:hypothetical protein